MRKGLALAAALTVSAGLFLTATPASAQTPPADITCLSNGSMETVVYGEQGDGVLVIGDEFAQELSGPREGKSMLGGKLQSVADADLTPASLVEAGSDETSPGVRARNAIATGPSKVVVAFRSGMEITPEAIVRVAVLAGEREVLWVAPVGNSLAHVKARTNLATAQSEVSNLRVIYPRLMLSAATQADPKKLTAVEANAIWGITGQNLKDGDRHRVVKVDDSCTEVVPAVDPGEAMRARALEFAQMVVSDPSSTYTFSTTTSPFISPYPYNCSTLVAAAYRFATEDAVQLEGFSDSQLWDMSNIELVPWSEARPGDIFFQKTMDDRFLGHVGMLLEKGANGGGTVIHACGDDGWCANAAANGMGYTDISILTNSGGLAYVTNPAVANTSRQGNIAFTQDYTQAWFGRVKTPSSGS